MNEIVLHIETSCAINIKQSGVYRYAQHPSFRLLNLSYSVDGGPVRLIDIEHGQVIPDEIIGVLNDDLIRKWAFDAQYARVCLSEWSRRKGFITSEFLAPYGWYCSKVAIAYFGFPLSREDVRGFLNTSGCKSVIELEMELPRKLNVRNIPQRLWDEYHLDQDINDRGVLVDMDFVHKAIAIDDDACSNIVARMKSLTGLSNPNSPAQMKQWLASQGINTASLDKAAVADIIEKSENPQVEQVLSLWQSLKKTSVEKYKAMNNYVCSDGRVRGMFQFYGAVRTGRWSSKGVQLQNLPQNHISNLEVARQIVASGDFNTFKLQYKDVRATLSQLIRIAFIPTKGYVFIIADYSAIEARVLAWLAGERWRQQVFANNEDIYSASASKMFGVPVVKNGENGHLRAKGKVAELALGYGGSVNALVAMGATKTGISYNEFPNIIEAWRASNPCIVKFWDDVEKAAVNAIQSHATQTLRNIKVHCRDDSFMFIELPSGRCLSYPKPEVQQSLSGRSEITYEGIDSRTNRWGKIRTYGAKLVENIVQGTSRDLLAHAMNNLRNYRIVMHIHDEIVLEATPDVKLSDVSDTMKLTPSWGKGLKLDVEAFSSPFYKKG